MHDHSANCNKINKIQYKKYLKIHLFIQNK